MGSSSNVSIRIMPARENRKADIRANRARRQQRELARLVAAPRRRKVAGLALAGSLLLWACLAAALAWLL